MELFWVSEGLKKKSKKNKKLLNYIICLGRNDYGKLNLFK